MSQFAGVPVEAGFVPLPPLQLAMKIHDHITGLQLVLPGSQSPEHVQGRSSALGPLSQKKEWKKGQVLFRHWRKLSEWLHLGTCAESHIPLWPSQIRRSPAEWRWALSSRALVLEASQPCVPRSSFTDILEHKRLSIWDSGFQSPKQSCWDYLAQLSSFCVLWRLLLDSVKVKSQEVNVEILTYINSKMEHPWELTCQIPLLGKKKGRRGFVGIDLSKSIMLAEGLTMCIYSDLCNYCFCLLVIIVLSVKD